VATLAATRYVDRQAVTGSGTSNADAWSSRCQADGLVEYHVIRPLISLFDHLLTVILPSIAACVLLRGELAPDDAL
jgi:hypothetical protein